MEIYLDTGNKNFEMVTLIQKKPEPFQFR